MSGSVDREIAIRRVVPDLEVDRGMLDRDAQVGFGDVVDALAPVPHDPAVLERRTVLVGGTQRHTRQSRRPGPRPAGSPRGHRFPSVVPAAAAGGYRTRVTLTEIGPRFVATAGRGNCPRSARRCNMRRPTGPGRGSNGRPTAGR